MNVAGGDPADRRFVPLAVNLRLQRARRQRDAGHDGAAGAEVDANDGVMTRLRHALAGEAGFTLLEVLLATLLMTVILAALATVTAQWLPNWNRGMARVQRAERLAIGLDRIVADLSVAEMMP